MERGRWKVTPLWKVTLNWKGEVHEIMRHAPTEMSALMLACREVGRKLGVEPGAVRSHVVGKAKWSVKMVREGRNG